MNIYKLMVSAVMASPLALSALVFDSFSSGDLHLSLTGMVGTSVFCDSPVGTIRVVDINSRLAAPGAVLTSDVSTAAGTLSFFADGESIDARPLQLGVSYDDLPANGLYDISDYDGFIFDFSAVTGEGHLIIEIGTPSSSRANLIRIPIIEAGWLTIPFDSIYSSPGRGVDSVNVLHLTFEAATPVFGFTLDEITLATVPEPAGYALGAGAASLACLVLRRRRKTS